MDEGESRNSQYSPTMKKQAGRRVKNVGLSYILLTIILTSCAWLVLDFYLIYVAGFQKSHREGEAWKLPLDRRDVDSVKFNAKHQQQQQRMQLDLDGANLKLPTGRFDRAVQKMKQMKKGNARHFTGQIDLRAAGEAAARHRLVENQDDLKFREFNNQPGNVDKDSKEFIKEKDEVADDTRESNVEIQQDNPIWEKVRNIDVTSVPRDSNGPGEAGKPVPQLPGEQAAMQREWVKAEFNLYANSKMSLERSLQDVRMPSCKDLRYPYDALPKTSVIICFTDETWPTLLRSVHSVINRSPPELLEELILVDDFSQAAHLQGPLEDYIAKLPKVKLLRLPSRQGLIRARLAGVNIAKGPVLTFLDSHIEACVGWLEPLLDRIRQNRTNVVTPVIDSIDAKTMRYSVASNTLRGGFTWIALQFRWRGTPSNILDERRAETDPVPSPTMAGGLFSIDKEFFLKLGTYDPGLEIWGAENLELSFKSWMCGGRLEIIPCSHVGHIFRAKQPYKFPSGDNVKTFLRNTLRVVNVWLDDYKKVFYAVNPDMLNTEYGDVSDRLQLKEDLHCQNFDWYIKNVYPNLEIPPSDVMGSGDLVNHKWNQCLDKFGGPQGVAVFPCHGLGGNQAFRITWDGLLAVGDICFGPSRKGNASPLTEINCRSPKVIHWYHSQGGILKNPETNLCLGVATDKKLAMMPCFNPGSHLQWSFKNYFPKEK